MALGNRGRPPGHTKFSNDLLEALYSVDWPRLDVQLVLFMERQTTGWHRPALNMRAVDRKHHFPVERIAQEMGASRNGVQKALKRLQRRRVIYPIQESAKGSATCWGIERNPDEWVRLGPTGVGAKNSKMGPTGVDPKNAETSPKSSENGPTPVLGPTGVYPMGPTGVGPKRDFGANGCGPLLKERAERKIKESDAAEKLIELIEQEQLKIELTEDDRRAIREIVSRYPTSTVDELHVSFRNSWGYYHDEPDRRQVHLWAENIGNRPPASSRNSSRMTRFQQPTLSSRRS